MRIGRWIFRLTLALPLAVLIGYLPYHAYGPQGIGQARVLQRELERLQQSNEKLQRDNGELQHRIERLRGSRRAVERVARDELGLVRPGDLVFQFE